MGGLKVEEAADDRQIIFYPMMNLPQQRFFSFLAGAQRGCILLGRFRVLRKSEDSRKGKGKHGRSGERNRSSK